MEESFRITPPLGAGDTEGAGRVFKEFLHAYQPILVRTEHYLEQMIQSMEPAYAAAYVPWHKSLRDLFHGAYLMARNIPLPDPESFVEALRVFSFEGAAQFLRDLCSCCRLNIPRDWAERFREHIDLLLFSLSILNRGQQQGVTR